VGCRAGLEFLKKINISCPGPEIESRFLGFPARSLDIPAEEVMVKLMLSQEQARPASFAGWHITISLFVENICTGVLISP
jgi:hypothetical protein